METGTRIDYKKLREINPEAARKAVLEYLMTNNHNIANTARVFGINRTVVYDILRKEKEGDLKRNFSLYGQIGLRGNRHFNRFEHLINKNHI